MFRRLESAVGNKVTVTVNGQEIEAFEEDTVAAVALSAGLHFTRTTPVSGAKRAPFCLMGVCFDCLMKIDGVANQRACMAKVKDGMQIETQSGAGDKI